jgi:hypothetical protein
MAEMTFNNQLTALLVIDPYNDFISEGDKIWPRIKAVAEANNCLPHMLQVLKCRMAGEAPRLLCRASSVPCGRLRNLEICCAYSEGGVEKQELRTRHVGWRNPCRVRAQVRRDRRRRALVFQRLRQHGSRFTDQEARHPSAHRHRSHRNMPNYATAIVTTDEIVDAISSLQR